MVLDPQVVLGSVGELFASHAFESSSFVQTSLMRERLAELEEEVCFLA